jgi:limonene-1,2-epoxide hydrolase
MGNRHERFGDYCMVDRLHLGWDWAMQSSRRSRFFTLTDAEGGYAMTIAENETLVREFIGAWSRLDVEELLDYFAEDGVYHNMPIEPVSGKAALRPFIAAFLNGWTSTDWEVLNLAVRGNIVIAERVDRTRLGAIAVDLPCCGVFEIEAGKIKVWRDYFDMATYTRAVEAG